MKTFRSNTRLLGRSFKRLSALVIAVCLAAVESSMRETRAQGTSCLVSTVAGDVQGTDLGGSCAFLGIPFAASTADSNRWKPPQPAAPWALINATTPPAPCPQVLPAGGLLPGTTEDCLRLNIWVSDPPANSPAPVIVWLHTGAFFGASANFLSHNGKRLAEETGAIVVAPNYRLGPFGFLAHSALAAEDPAYPSSGNYGLLDQRAALKWVRDNIAQFGGDPGNVTIAGTSAGGDSVGLHLVSPASGGLFHRAIIQSGYSETVRRVTHAEATAQGDAFATALGCTDPSQVLGCMRSKTRDQVLLALSQAMLQVVEPPNRVYWEPVVDGVEIPDQPRTLYELGAFHQVPTMIGTTRDEAWVFTSRSFPAGVSFAQYEGWVANEFGAEAPSVLATYPAANFPSPTDALARVVGDGQFASEARRLARLVERTGTPTFLYSYEYEIDDLSVDHVIHGVESNIIFGNNYVPPVFSNHVLTSADLTLHSAMAGYWTRFAATGNPNSDDDNVVHWPAFKHPPGEGRGVDKYIIFDSAIREGQRPREEQSNFWEPFFFRSMLGALPASNP
jgi:para-nitrobenzyl esterase